MSNSASALAAARFEWYPPEDLAARPPYEHFVLYTVPMTFPWLVPSSIKKVVTLVETGQEVSPLHSNRVCAVTRL